jgi:hypothetical protein
LDKKIIFDQVRVHEKTIIELKKIVTENGGTGEDADSSPVWKAIGMIVGVQEGLMSAVIDMEAAEAAAPCVSNAAGTVVMGGRVVRGGAALGAGAVAKPAAAPVIVDPVESEKKNENRS